MKTRPAIALISFFLASALHIAPQPSLAQDGPERQQGHAERRIRVLEQSPRIGPVGTRATLTASHMPALTAVQVVMGGARSGFEELALTQTNLDSELHVVVEVPEWAQSDRPHRFIVFNVYFSAVLAESGIFHVTDANGRVTREGRVGSAGDGCTTLEGNDGERYRLTGNTDSLTQGQHTTLQGTLTESTEGCGEGLSLDLSVHAAGENEPPTDGR